jgi:Tfp pilus assembly protein PilF
MVLKVKEYRQDIFLFLSAFVVFGTSLFNGFVGDDLIYFIGNDRIKSFDIKTILLSGALEVDYCPLRDLSLGLDYLLWGETPMGFHLTNLFLYGVTIVAIKYLYLSLQSFLVYPASPPTHRLYVNAPFIAALLFAFHPVHGEVVFAASNRGVLLSGLFFTLSCTLFLHCMRRGGHQNLFYAGSLVCYVASVLSKEYAIILPLILVLFAAYGEDSSRVRNFVRSIPFFLISVVLFISFRAIALSARFIPKSAENLTTEIGTKLITAIQIIAYYLFRMLNLEKIGIYLSSVFSTLPQAFLYFSLIIVGIILFAVYALRKRLPSLQFGFLFYLVCLIPVLNFFKTSPVTADRFAYLPSIGLLFAATSVSSMRRSRSVAVLVTVVVMYWAFLSWGQTSIWKDNVAYWEHITGIDPTPESYSHLGNAYLKNNDKIRSRESFMNALRILPDNADSKVQGELRFMLGDNPGAISAFERAIEEDVSFPGRRGQLNWSFFNNVATAYKNVGNLTAARRYLEHAVSLKSGSASLHNSLGALYGEMKLYDLSIKEFETSMTLDPGYGFASLNLARTYLLLKDHKNAERYLILVRENFPQLRDEANALENR